jgi:hypothetical protein
MAQYKVPQDVEADDKLIGPFSFRQFIYLLIVALACALVWGLYKILPPLAVIPFPIIIFFGALALPLRKDQPMEIFMAAMVSFYLKPRRRLWEPDGIDSLIEITAPKTVDFQRTKNISTNEAEKRFSYLAQIVDSRGWAIRSPGGVQIPNSAMNSDVFFEAQQTPDVLDTNSFTVKQIDNKLAQSDSLRYQKAMGIMQHKPAPNTYTTPTTPPDQPINLEFNPYPEDIHQSVVQPLSKDNIIEVEQSEPKYTPTTSKNTISADIINLASNTDLSIETIAHEANRIMKKQEASEEVVISLR